MNPPPPSAPAPSGSSSSPTIDVEKLAEKVYRLMLADLRMEIARQGGTAGRR